MLVHVRALCTTCIVYRLVLIWCILRVHAGFQDLEPGDEVRAESDSLVQIQWKRGSEILPKLAAHHWQGKALMEYHSLLVNESQRIQSPGRKGDLSAETLPPQPRLAHTCTGTLAQHRASGHPYRACFDVSIHISLTFALIWDSQSDMWGLSPKFWEALRNSSWSAIWGIHIINQKKIMGYIW